MVTTKPTRGNSSPRWCSHLGDNPSGRGPALRLIVETLEAHQGRAARPSRRTKQNLLDLQLQALVRRHADGIVHAALLERVVDLGLRERGVCAERHARARRRLPVNFRHEQVVPVVGAMHGAGPQRSGEAVPVLSEQKQRVVADGLEVPVLGAPFLRPMHRTLARIHVEHDPVGARCHLGPVQAPPGSRPSTRRDSSLGSAARSRTNATSMSAPHPGPTSLATR